MGKDVVKVGQTYIAKGAGQEVGKALGRELLRTGAGGLVIGGVAWLLPFITLPMLLVAAVLAGLFFIAKD